MKRRYLIFISGAIGAGIVLVAAGAFMMGDEYGNETSPPREEDSSFSEREAGFERADGGLRVGHRDRYSLEELRTFERPAGTSTVALQVGHLKNDEVPEELSQLTANGAGAQWRDVSEREVVREIVRLVAQELRRDGIAVDILPTTVPPGYYADAFVSVHADGNNDPQVRGYKTAHFSHDYSGVSQHLEEAVAEHYASRTGLPEDRNVTYYMTGYYAFNWWRYEHALHPMTPAMILETGFLTNAADRAVIVNTPERAARGIAEGVRAFLAADAEERVMPRMITLPTPPFTGIYRCLEGERDANDPPDAAEECRPGLVVASGGQRIDTGERRQNNDINDDEDDESTRRERGKRYGFTFPGGAPSTVLAGIREGDEIIVRGTFTPMIEERDLSWYDYQVRGTIEVRSISSL